MRQLSLVWSAAAPQDRYQSTMLWAAACLAFFGFFRLGELFGNAISPPAMLASDVAVDSHTSPTVLKVHLRKGKTDPFGLGVSLYLGRTGSELCPVYSMLKFLAIRKPNNDVLFTHEDGTPMARDYFVGRVREALYAARLDPSKYSGHSSVLGLLNQQEGWASLTMLSRCLADGVLRLTSFIFVRLQNLWQQSQRD